MEKRLLPKDDEGWNPVGCEVSPVPKEPRPPPGLIPVGVDPKGLSIDARKGFAIPPPVICGRKPRPTFDPGDDDGGLLRKDKLPKPVG